MKALNSSDYVSLIKPTALCRNVGVKMKFLEGVMYFFWFIEAIIRTITFTGKYDKNRYYLFLLKISPFAVSCLALLSTALILAIRSFDFSDIISSGIEENIGILLFFIFFIFHLRQAL
jgi:hypothetical protein